MGCLTRESRFNKLPTSEPEQQAIAHILGKLDKIELNRRMFPLPPQALLEVFNGAVTPLFKRAHGNEMQDFTLATLRDALLHRLISGELRVGEAERLVEETA